MSSKLNRTAAGVFAVLMAMAIVDVSNSLAQAAPTADEIISTTCGAGTLEKCSDKPIEDCDWDISFTFSGATRSFGFNVKRSDCQVTGTVPIYKDHKRESFTLSPSCNLLLPFLGMPAGAGCS